MNEKNKICLELMLKYLFSFQSKKIALWELIIYLEPLFHSMDNSKEWEDKFLEEFSTLESINAESPNMAKKEIECLINSSVESLINLIKLSQSQCVQE